MKTPIIIKTPSESEIKQTASGIYCDKGCGYDHTREQYQAAFDACENALKYLQDNGYNRDGQWTGIVWDNCGWHWRLVSGGPFSWNLSQYKTGLWYCTNYHEVDLPSQYRSGHHEKPEDAIREVISQMNASIKQIEAERKHLTDGLL